ncbi:MAG: BadF/BadG/BcrA/BcrD ATPase family protein [Elusimicrobiota bacterium]
MTDKTPKTAKNRLAAGVDRGGTRTRIVLINGRGSELKKASHPSSHIKLLPNLIIKTALEWKLEPHIPVIIATRGAMTRKWKKPFLIKKLKGKINLLDVISDAQAAYLAAHGAGNGALLIAGTGSVVFLKRRSGRFEKIGGHSPAGGDPGSGLWIGTRFLKIKKMKKKGLDRRARAAYAAIAVNSAESGDLAAIGLVRQAHEHLSNLLAGAVKKHIARGSAAAGTPGQQTDNARKPLRVALTGGLMQNAFFRKTFIVRARGQFAPVRLVFTTLKRTAEYAAARLAMENFYGRNKGT